jgi:hypothetical protein
MPSNNDNAKSVEHHETYRHRRNDTRQNDIRHPEAEELDTLNEIVSPGNEREDATTAGVLRPDEIQAHFTDSADQWTVDVGIDVVGSCGHKIGEVVDVRDDYLVVEKGFFMPEDVFVPKSAIADVDPHHLTLNVTKNTADHSHWDEDPEEPAPRRPPAAS